MLLAVVWALAALITAIGDCDVLVALGSGPFFVRFWLFLFLFACFLRGSICISDRWKCISTQRRWVGCCSLPPLVVQFTRASHLLLLLFYSHLQDRAIELNRPTQKKKTHWSSRLRQLPQSVSEKKFVVLQQLSFECVTSFNIFEFTFSDFFCKT